MSVPKNPNTIVVKNEFYPNGLTEGQVWNYYQNYKGVILNNTRGRDLMFAIMVEVNNPVIKRHENKTSLIRLDNNNYDKMITGRTITIYSTMKAYEDFFIVDVDTDNWNKAISVTKYVYNLIQKADFVRDIKLLYTGKNSFHIYAKLANRMPIDRIRYIVDSYLKSNQTNEFTILPKRNNNKPNIDLFINKYRGAYITESSLSIMGLKAIFIPISKIDTFKKWYVKI